jgi:hypothetical protein
MSDLDNFVKEADDASPYIRFKDNESVEGMFIKGVVVQDSFNKDQETIEYTLEVNETAKTFRSRSIGLARQLNGLEGTSVKVTKKGTGFDTVWKVEKL